MLPRLRLRHLALTAGLALMAGLPADLPAAVSVHVGASSSSCRPHRSHHHHRHYRSGGIHPYFGLSIRSTPRVVTRETTVVRTVPARSPAPVRQTPWQNPCPGTTSYHTYHANGVLSVSGTMRSGTRHGRWDWFDHNGRRLQQGHYNDGQRDGLWIRYDSNGNVRYQANYDNGRLISDTGRSCSWL